MQTEYEQCHSDSKFCNRCGICHIDPVKEKCPMAKAKRKKEATRRPVTRADFIGAKMANFLFNLKYNSNLSEKDRAYATTLQEQWDSVAVFRIDNPIVAAEYEKAMAAGELK
jgi:hypothetical protein